MSSKHDSFMKYEYRGVIETATKSNTEHKFFRGEYKGIEIRYELDTWQGW